MFRNFVSSKFTGKMTILPTEWSKIACFVGKQMENEQNQIQCRKMSKVHSSCVEDYGHFNYILTGEWTRKISPAPNNRYLHCDEIQHEIGSSAVGGGQTKLLVEIG